MFEIISALIFDIGLTLGVGSSTFALAFYIRALEDGIIDASEKRLMHVVYTVLRIGMVLIAIGLASSLFHADVTLSAQYFMQWTLLAIITLNALGMTFKIMPMKYGPTLAGGSWYALFFVTALPLAVASYWILILSYAVFLVAFHLIFGYLHKRFTSKA